jgi:hypothetical protein
VRQDTSYFYEDTNIFGDGQLLSKDMKQIYFDQVEIYLNEIYDNQL